MDLSLISGVAARVCDMAARTPDAILRHKRWALGIAMAVTFGIAVPVCTLGCGMAASPQPPSLQLPTAVRDLTAASVGNQVSLHWDTPSETTDKLKIRGPVRVRICRQPAGMPCETVATIAATPGKPADYADALPSTLLTGPLHAINYQIFAVNKHGRSAGPSNTAAALAGEAPPPIQDLTATMAERGVVLRWRSITNLQPDTSIWLQRTLLRPESHLNRKIPGVLPPVSEPAEQTLRIELDTGRDPGTALDSSAVFSRRYQYVATRIVELSAGARLLAMASAPSPPVTILTRDTFPPAAPIGLAVVPVPEALNGGKPEVDLSWSANSEPDLAHYLVYRRDVNIDDSLSKKSAAEQIAPENPQSPVVAPAFRDMHVQPGHTYAYSVVAVDNAGNKSSISPEIMVTVPSR